MKQNSNLNPFQQLLFHTIPPPLNQYNLSCAKTAPRAPCMVQKYHIYVMVLGFRYSQLCTINNKKIMRFKKIFGQIFAKE